MTIYYNGIMHVNMTVMITSSLGISIGVMLSAGAAKTLKACCCVAWRRWLSADRVSSGGSQDWWTCSNPSQDGHDGHIQNVLPGAT